MSESTRNAGLLPGWYEGGSAYDSSNLWSDESGDSGADEIAASGGLPVGGLTIVMQLAEEVGVIGPPVAVGMPCFLHQHEYGMKMHVQPFHDWDDVLQGVREQDHEEQLLAMASGDCSGDHTAWNGAGFWWYNYDSGGRLLGVEDVRSQRHMRDEGWWGHVLPARHTTGNCVI